MMSYNLYLSGNNSIQSSIVWNNHLCIINEQNHFIQLNFVFDDDNMVYNGATTNKAINGIEYAMKPAKSNTVIMPCM